jgi:hypothetical protein
MQVGGNSVPVRILTVPFDPIHGVFDDEALQGFLASKKTYRIEPQFFSQHGQAFWSIYIEYDTLLEEPEVSHSELAAPQQELLKQLQAWRKEKAAETKMPSYVISTNRQLIEVATKSAIIGVKGTRFVVDYQQDQVNVFLRNGQLDVRSLSGQFKRYRQKQRAEFDTFRQQMMGDFKQYKQQLHEEFVEYVEQFNMASGSAISIGNNEVRDLKIPVDIQAEFDWIDRF